MAVKFPNLHSKLFGIKAMTKIIIIRISDVIKMIIVENGEETAFKI
jgi:hypothetical protein